MQITKPQWQHLGLYESGWMLKGKVFRHLSILRQSRIFLTEAGQRTAIWDTYRARKVSRLPAVIVTQKSSYCAYQDQNGDCWVVRSKTQTGAIPGSAEEEVVLARSRKVISEKAYKKLLAVV